MNVHSEIVAWGATLPAWQSDALRRLLQQGELSPEDIAAVLRMLKAANGYTDKDNPAPVPQPLLKSHLPAQMDDRRTIILQGMHSLGNVNALATQQTLRFTDKGITTVYGDNAAGKSGYSRVLKRACRARDKAEAILPNVLGKAKPTGPATASFDLLVQDTPQTVTWTDGTPPPEELARLIVFDSKCATFYIDKANQVIYVPIGLDVFPKLAALLAGLRTQLQAETNSIRQAPKCLTEFSPTTGVGQFVAKISAKTTEQDLDAQAAFTPEAKARVAWLRSAIAESKASDPKARAARLRRLKRRVEKFADTVGALETALSAEAVVRLEKLQASAETARDAARLASQLSFAKEPLPDVGGPVWRDMYEAARRYSEARAYPGQTFPVLDGAARCPLCQQELEDEAKERLGRFDQFVRDNTAQQAAAKDADFAAERKRLEELDTAPLARDPELISEIASVAAETAPLLEAYIAALQARTAAALKACTEKNWHAVPGPLASPAQSLAELGAQLEAEAIRLDQAAQPEEQTKLETELAELDAREKLARYKDELMAYVEGLQRYRFLQACIDATATTHVSRKATEIAKEAITGVLEKALGEEIGSLGVGHVPLQLKKA